MVPNMPVRLKVNKDVADGFCNAAKGVVADIAPRTESGHVKWVGVRFADPRVAAKQRSEEGRLATK